MFAKFAKYLLLSILVTSPSLSAGQQRYRFEPAPADRAKHKYLKKPGGLKYNKYGLIDPSPDVVSLTALPKDEYGFVDWAKAIKEGTIAPRETIGPPAGEEQTVEFTKEILIRSKMDFMPDVVFPHQSHTVWLRCSNCHSKIFEMKAGATPISMVAIWKGEYCGRCHDRVAFPVRNCFKCHSVPNEAKRQR